VTGGRVALTGGIATGKSYVRSAFAALGVPTIDADLIARDVLAPGTPGLAAVAAHFGAEILDASHALDRQRLAAIVFADPDARRHLEAIVHPAVRAAIEAWFATVPAAWALADIPLLYETGRAAQFDLVIVTTCAPATQLARLIAGRGLTREEAGRRIAAQLPLADKMRRADYVIDTNGSFEETDRQVRLVYDRVEAGFTGRRA
jgi:dephospho-CoA kinase